MYSFLVFCFVSFLFLFWCLFLLFTDIYNWIIDHMWVYLFSTRSPVPKLDNRYNNICTVYASIIYTKRYRRTDSHTDSGTKCACVRACVRACVCVCFHGFLFFLFTGALFCRFSLFLYSERLLVVSSPRWHLSLFSFLFFFFDSDSSKYNTLAAEKVSRVETILDREIDRLLDRGIHRAPVSEGTAEGWPTA